MREEELAEELGALIRRLRLGRGYSQAGFAEACKIDRAHMGEVERGEINVTVRTALKIAKGLEMTLAGLFEELETDGK